MNFATPLGFIMGALVVYYGVTMGIKNPSVFLDAHAAIIVFGGTLAAAFICLPLRQILNTVKVFFRALLNKGDQEIILTINEIVGIAQGIDRGSSLESLTGSIKNAFLKESLELLSQEGLEVHELEEVLEKRVEIQNEKYRREANSYKIIGKFPPAFGLVGTSLGMVALLQGLGEPNAFDRLGPSMSIALVATFYGLVLANVLIIPVGENVTLASENDLVMRRLVVDGVRLVRDKKHPLLVEEYLKSYLAPHERNKMKKAA